ncbi:hypothetical protein ANN_26730 [Periplaneta americana]|uniref:Uncharacterized protein n=1 Tax=Periplaneta americana TaxID=6978 RepID=A0ABQ8RZ18_PERAM|nr:hypothetical protein ANN_26730 [Periplaneta americana]
MGPKISKKDTGWREAIPIQERIALTLRYLATGDSYTSLMYLFKMSKQLITRIVPEECTAIIEELEDFIKFRHPVGEIELSAAFCYELQASGKSRPQRIPTSFDVPTSDGSLPKANQTMGLPLLRRTHVPISISECIPESMMRWEGKVGEASELQGHRSYKTQVGVICDRSPSSKQTTVLVTLDKLEPKIELEMHDTSRYLLTHQ